MNNESKCIKCGSEELLLIPTLVGEEPHIVVGEVGMHMVPITRMVCARCGYIEQWITNSEDLEKLRQEYDKSTLEK